MILGAPIIVLATLLDFLIIAQALFGTTLDGQPGTRLELSWLTFAIWGGATALGIALILFGVKLRESRQSQTIKSAT